MNKEQEKEFKRLERHAKDCGVAFGIYSKEYAEAIHEMNDYWQFHHKRTTKELFSETKNKVKRWILKNC